MKKMVMFSIAMLVVSSTAFAGQRGNNRAMSNVTPAHKSRGGNPAVWSPTADMSDVTNPNNIGQNGGSDPRTWAPLPASSLTPASNWFGGTKDSWAPTQNAKPHHIHAAMAVVHEAMSRLHTAMTNVSGAAMSKLHPAMQNLEMAASKLNAAMSTVKKAQSRLTPAQVRLVNDAMVIVGSAIIDPFLINLFPAQSGMTGNGSTNTPGFAGGGSTNTPGFDGGNNGATDTPTMMTPLNVFASNVNHNAMSNVNNNARARGNSAAMTNATSPARARN
jgi:hypothetical protein